MTDSTEPGVVAPEELHELVEAAAVRRLPFDTPAEIEPVVIEVVRLLRPLVRSRADLDRLSRTLPDLMRTVECWSDETPMGYLHDYDTRALRALVVGCDTVAALLARIKAQRSE